MSKINLCVIFGGASSEHEVSLLSAASVLRNLDMTKYTVHTIGISKDGGWYYYTGNAETMSELKNPDVWNFDRAIISPDRDEKAILRFTEDGVEKYPLMWFFRFSTERTGRMERFRDSLNWLEFLMWAPVLSAVRSAWINVWQRLSLPMREFPRRIG